MPNMPLLKTVEIAIAESEWVAAGRIIVNSGEECADIEVRTPWLDPFCKSMSHDDVRALRDALIELYPVEQQAAPAAPVPAYHATPSVTSEYDWCVIETAVAPTSRVWARTTCKDDAERLAAIMNKEATNAAP